MKHHYIPIFYIKAWAINKGRLWQYNRPREEIFVQQKYPAEVAFKHNLYTLTGLPQGSQEWLETGLLSGYDNRAALVLERMRQGLLPAGSTERSDWSRFVISLLHRNPEKIAFLQQEWNRVQAEIHQDLPREYQKYRRETDPETYAEYLKVRPTHGSKSSDQHFAEFIKSITDSKRVGQHFVNMIWEILNVSGRHPLMTSDRPILITNGIAHQDSYLLMSIDEKNLFVATNNRKTMDSIKSLQTQLGRTYNEKVVEHAKDFVFTSRGSDKEFIDRRLGKGTVQFIGSRGFPSANELWKMGEQGT